MELNCCFQWKENCPAIKKQLLYSPDLGFGRGGIVDRGAACGCLKRAVESTDGDFGTIISYFICVFV